jgi:hypothetical protein
MNCCITTFIAKSIKSRAPETFKSFAILDFDSEASFDVNPTFLAQAITSSSQVIIIGQKEDYTQQVRTFTRSLGLNWQTCFENVAEQWRKAC